MGHDDPMLHGQPPASRPLSPAGNLDEELSMSGATATDVTLARALRELSLPPGEVAAAREQVWTRLLEDMARERPSRTATVRTDSQTRASRPPDPRAWRGSASRSDRKLVRSLLLIAAMLLMFVATGVGVSLASASAPPSSPLYGIKRAEEWLALHTAGSDQRRGDILLAIASRRLSEAQAESDANHNASVRSLVQELDGTVTDVIDLALVMTSRHEDVTVVTAGLERILDDEDAAQSRAQKRGHQALATALGE